MSPPFPFSLTDVGLFSSGNDFLVSQNLEAYFKFGYSNSPQNYVLTSTDYGLGFSVTSELIDYDTQFADADQPGIFTNPPATVPYDVSTLGVVSNTSFVTDGNYWAIASAGNNRVWLHSVAATLSQNGIQLSDYPAALIDVPAGVLSGNRFGDVCQFFDGKLYVTCPGQGRIYVYDMSKNLLFDFTHSDTPNTRWGDGKTAVAGGKVVVGDSGYTNGGRVYVYDAADGGNEIKIDRPGTSFSSFGKKVAVNSTRIFVSSFESSTSKGFLHAFDHSGNLIFSFGPGDARFAQGHLFADEDGVLVASSHSAIGGVYTNLLDNNGAYTVPSNVNMSTTSSASNFDYGQYLVERRIYGPWAGTISSRSALYDTESTRLLRLFDDSCLLIAVGGSKSNANTIVMAYASNSEIGEELVFITPKGLPTDFASSNPASIEANWNRGDTKHTGSAMILAGTNNSWFETKTVPSLLDKFTLEIYADLSSSNVNDEPWLFNLNDGTDTVIGLYYSNSTKFLTCKIKLQDGNTYTFNSSNQIVEDSVSRIGLTIDTSNQDVSIYVNNTKESFSITSLNFATFNNMLLFSKIKNAPTNANSVLGDIKIVRIYSNALTQSQMNSNYTITI